MKKLLLVSLICLLIFSFAITAMAKIELEFWTYMYHSDPNKIKEYGWFENRIIEEFQEIYPEVEINLQVLPWTKGPEKVTVSIVTGTTPDILQDCDMRIMTYVAAGAMVDFEDTMDAEEQADHYTSFLDMVKFKDKVYMYIWMAGIGGMSVNKLVVEKAGAMDLLPLDREDRDWTVEEFKEFCLKIAEANIPGTYALTFHFADSNCQQLYINHVHQSFGAEPFVIEDGKYRCTLNSPEAVEGLEWYLELYNIPRVGMPSPETQGIDYKQKYYQTGKLATCISCSTNQIVKERMNKAIEDTCETLHVAVPHKEGLRPKGIPNVAGFGVFKSTPEEEKYAKLFCEFFVTRPYFWEITRSCPPRKSAKDPNSPLYQTCPYTEIDSEIRYSENAAAYMDAVDYGAKCPVYQEYRNIYTATMQGVFTGQLTAQEGLDIVVERVNKLLDDYYEENPVE